MTNVMAVAMPVCDQVCRLRVDRRRFLTVPRPSRGANGREQTAGPGVVRGSPRAGEDCRGESFHRLPRAPVERLREDADVRGLQLPGELFPGVPPRARLRGE